MPHFKKGSPEAKAWMAKLRARVGRMRPDLAPKAAYKKRIEELDAALRRGEAEDAQGTAILMAERDAMLKKYHRANNPLTRPESAVLMRSARIVHRWAQKGDRPEFNRGRAVAYADAVHTFGAPGTGRVGMKMRERVHRDMNPSHIFALDTRSTGPAFCDECEAELEDAKLTERGWVCPECGAPLGKIDFEYFVRPGEAEKAYGKRKGNPLTDEESAELLDSAHGDLMHAKASLKGPDNRAMKDYVYGKAAMAGLTVSLYGPKGLEKQGSKTFRVARRLGQRTSAQDVNYHRALRQSVEGRSRNPPLLILGNPGKRKSNPLTLNGWVNEYRIPAEWHPSGARTVYAPSVKSKEARWALFHLTDFFVSGERAGTYWLTPFTKQERASAIPVLRNPGTPYVHLRKTPQGMAHDWDSGQLAPLPKSPQVVTVYMDSGPEKLTTWVDPKTGERHWSNLKYGPGERAWREKNPLTREEAAKLAKRFGGEYKSAIRISGMGGEPYGAWRAVGAMEGITEALEIGGQERMAGALRTSASRAHRKAGGASHWHEINNRIRLEGWKEVGGGMVAGDRYTAFVGSGKTRGHKGDWYRVPKYNLVKNLGTLHGKVIDFDELGQMKPEYRALFKMGKAHHRQVNPLSSAVKIRRGNPSAKMLPPHIANDPAWKRELAAYRRRHGCDPKFVTAINTPSGSPRFASAWGKMPEAKYDAPPDASNKGRRVHKFGESGGKQPYLVSSVEKGPRYLQIVGGTFRAGGEWILR